MKIGILSPERHIGNILQKYNNLYCMARLYKNLETSRNVGKLYILYTRKYLPPFIFALLPPSSLGDFQTEQLLFNVFEQKQNHFGANSRRGKIA